MYFFFSLSMLEAIVKCYRFFFTSLFNDLRMFSFGGWNTAGKLKDKAASYICYNHAVSLLLLRRKTSPCYRLGFPLSRTQVLVPRSIIYLHLCNNLKTPWLKTTFILLTNLQFGQNLSGTVLLCYIWYHLSQFNGWQLESSEISFTQISSS